MVELLWQPLLDHAVEAAVDAEMQGTLVRWGSGLASLRPRARVDGAVHHIVSVLAEYVDFDLYRDLEYRAAQVAHNRCLWYGLASREGLNVLERYAHPLER